MKKRSYTLRKSKSGLAFFAALLPLVITVIMLIVLIFQPQLEATVKMESVGISIISIAVSVWIGLNIYNLLSKRELEEALEKVNKAEGMLYKQVFFKELEKTLGMYVLSKYFYDEFYDDDELLPYSELSKVENMYVQCSLEYERNEWKISREKAEQSVKAINKILKKHKRIVKNKKLFEMYLKCRLADAYFYKNIALPRENGNEFCKTELVDSIVYYEEALKELEFEEPEYRAYVHNTIGYTHHMLGKKTDAESIEHRQKALEHMNNAIALNPKNGRYYRNRGLLYQFYFERDHLCEEEIRPLTADDCYKNALQDYKKSVSLEKTDYKSYNNIAALSLKKLDTKYGVDGRDVTLNTQSGFKQEAILDSCFSYLDIASKLSPVFEDVLYNTGKVYMYKYLTEDQKDPQMIEQGIRITKQVEIINSQNKGYLYVLRNLYEAKGDIKEAYKINEKLAGNGDAQEIKKMYECYLKG